MIALFLTTKLFPRHQILLSSITCQYGGRRGNATQWGGRDHGGAVSYITIGTKGRDPLSQNCVGKPQCIFHKTVPYIWCTVYVKPKLMLFQNRRFILFLLLARYVPNVAKRSTWHQCIYWGPTTNQPRILENFEWPYLGNGSSYPLHVSFYGRFPGCLHQMALLPVGPNPRSRRQPSCIIVNGHISETVHSIQFVFGSMVKM